MPDPRELLTRLEVAADSGALPRDISRWLLDGIAAHKEGRGLEAGLGLQPRPGVRAWCNASRVRERNRWLNKAACYVCNSGAGRWERAGRLADAIRTFQVRTWPRIRDHPTPQPDTPSGDLLNHFLALSFFAHPGDTDQFPASQRQLYRILSQ